MVVPAFAADFSASVLVLPFQSVLPPSIVFGTIGTAWWIFLAYRGVRGARWFLGRES